MTEKALVVSDAHVSIYENGSGENLIKLIEQRKKDFDTLILLGDTFDFYFEYDNFIPKNYFRVFEAINRVKKDKRIIISAGNHDMWLGEFFTRILEAEVKRGLFELNIGGRIFLLSHGDEFERKSLARRSVETILSSKPAIFLFSMIHPEIAYKLGDIVSKRTITNAKDEECMRFVCENAKKADKYKESDNILLGHSHAPHECEDKKTILIGDFSKSGEYALLSEKGVAIEHI